MNNLISALILVAFVVSGCAKKGPPNLNKEIQGIENGLVKSILVKGDSVEKFNIQDRMEYHNVPGISIAVVRGRKLRWAKGYGVANTETKSRVDTSTLFQAGSISKPLAALAALNLVEEGRLELDKDINLYLKGWKLKYNRFTDTSKVTLRRLLTHTAGTTVHGFPGYKHKDTFPTITEVLTGKGNTDSIYVDTIPGSFWRYSGGGYTVMEKAVEDVTEEPFEAYMKQYILDPLNMTKSTYEQPLPERYHANASAAYNSKGEIVEGYWHNYPEQAAAGLWTTPSDLAKYCIAIQEIVAGNESPVLEKSTINQMLTQHENDWGLGPSLVKSGDSLRFQHGGKNEGFTNNLIGFANTGDAVIVMTNADNGGRLIDEIMRSLSDYYDLGFRRSRVVELKEIKPEILQQLVGEYVYVEQVPGIGDYIMKLTIQDGKLLVFDPNDEQNYTMRAMDSLKFIDTELDEEISFKISTDSIGFKWNDQFQFYKRP
jgi:CubicO group peptidase (beta-lactamase class C family)